MNHNISLEILSKADCPLCDVAKEVTGKVLRDYPGIQLRCTDIETIPELFERYKEKIPVLRINGEDRFIYKVHEKGLRQRLNALIDAPS